MGVIVGLIFWLIGIGIALAVLHWIIRSAIDNSELTQEVKELKELLKAQQMGKVKEPQSPVSNHGSEKCPGCGEWVHITDVECKSCGLTLVSDDK